MQKGVGDMMGRALIETEARKILMFSKTWNGKFIKSCSGKTSDLKKALASADAVVGQFEGYLSIVAKNYLNGEYWNNR